MNRTSLVTLAACATLATGWATANERCRPLVAIATTTATSQTSFAGVATTNLGDANVYVVVNGIKPNADGTLNASTAHQFVIGALSFTTRDNARLVPLNAAGLYRLDTQASIGDGAWGHAKIDGLVDLGAGWAKWLATGEVCAK